LSLTVLAEVRHGDLQSRYTLSQTIGGHGRPPRAGAPARRKWSVPVQLAV
jgi:hypothetical protein